MELVQQLTSFSRHFPKSIHSRAQGVEPVHISQSNLPQKVPVSFRWTWRGKKTEAEINLLGRDPARYPASTLPPLRILL